MTNDKHASTEDVLQAVNDLGNNIATAMVDMEGRLGGRIDRVESRLDGVESHLNGVGSRLTSLEQSQHEMRNWLERVDSRLMGVESDIKEIYDAIIRLEKKQKLRDKELVELQEKVDRMADWMRKVAAKTGIVLPKL